MTANEMYAAYAARRINEMARTEECSADEIIGTYAGDDQQYREDLAEYKLGQEILNNHKVTIHRSSASTIRPTPADNQIVVDAGYIATSPAYMLVTVE